MGPRWPGRLAAPPRGVAVAVSSERPCRHAVFLAQTLAMHAFTAGEMFHERASILYPKQARGFTPPATWLFSLQLAVSSPLT